ncbi:hypothetical protein [Bosea sp. PAMC 26642]|uniref:hypothetical protein n=1 Tax=Bosea sp. (strain PAMC 26642) TaxID=1792307 RepID=UPI000AB63087|nr:hypothetical protein [Bosea sp. PAMC 26642]
MSPIRISARQGKRKPARSSFAVKPVTLPTFGCYGHLPVVYIDGELVIGRRVIPLGRRS